MVWKSILCCFYGKFSLVQARCKRSPEKIVDILASGFYFISVGTNLK